MPQPGPHVLLSLFGAKFARWDTANPAAVSDTELTDNKRYLENMTEPQNYKCFFSSSWKKQYLSFFL